MTTLDNLQLVLQVSFSPAQHTFYCCCGLVVVVVCVFVVVVLGFWCVLFGLLLFWFLITCSFFISFTLTQSMDKGAVDLGHQYQRILIFQ